MVFTRACTYSSISRMKIRGRSHLKAYTGVLPARSPAGRWAPYFCPCTPWTESFDYGPLRARDRSMNAAVKSLSIHREKRVRGHGRSDLRAFWDDHEYIECGLCSSSRAFTRSCHFEKRGSWLQRLYQFRKRGNRCTRPHSNVSIRRISFPPCLCCWYERMRPCVTKVSQDVVYSVNVSNIVILSKMFLVKSWHIFRVGKIVVRTQLNLYATGSALSVDRNHGYPLPIALTALRGGWERSNKLLE